MPTVAQEFLACILRLAFLLVAVLQLTAVSSANADNRPNLIFLLTDDHRRDSLGCYGNEIIETPNLDQLAKEGVLFENAFVTSAICTPSRASYFLGQYERKHGVNFNSGTAMDPAAWAESYPVVLRKSGYFTGYIGKNHVPIGPQGYRSGIMEQSFDFWYAGHGHLKFYPKEHHQIFQHAQSNTQVEILQEGAQSFLSDKTAFISGAQSFLKNRPTDKPFCLSIAFNLPHDSGTSTMELLAEDDELYRTHYRDRLSSLPLPKNYLKKSEIKTPKIPSSVAQPQFRQHNYDYVDQPGTLRERLVRRYQTVTGIDRLVGQLRAQLEELGIAKNTIIVFSSDHGIMHGEFGLGGKALNYEPCLAIPMIIMDPRRPASQRGTRLQELVMSIDIAPTLIEWGGAKIPSSVQGKSLTPLINDDQIEWRQETFAENLWSTIFGNPRCESVRTAQWKYIRYFANDRSIYEGIDRKRIYKLIPEQTEAYARWLTSSIQGEPHDYEELFDLEKDPEETTNLAGNPARQEQLAALRTRCQELVLEAKGEVSIPPLTIRLTQDTN